MKTKYQFKPKYGIVIYICYFFSLLMLTVGVFVLIVIGNFPIKETITFAVMLILLLLIPLIQLKKIEFHDKIYIFYYWGRIVTREYSKLIDIGKTSIKFNKLNIPIINMNNSEELMGIFDHLINCGIIDRNQLKNTLKVREKYAFKSSIFAIMITNLIMIFGNKDIMRIFNIDTIKNIEMFYAYEFIILFLFWYFLIYLFMSNLKKKTNLA